MVNGKIIVFEGIDGSGKGTQSKLLYKYYKKNNIKVALFEFPGYTKTFFGEVVGEFLNGDFGNLNEVHPKLSAILYAGDRFEQSKEIKDYLSKGYIVICDRYVSSNIAHQIAKLPIDKQEKLKEWIEYLEYKVFNLPKPNFILFLDMPPSAATQLVLKKDARAYTDKKKDIHEADQSYLSLVYNTFKAIAKKENWEIIECENKDITTIQNEIIHCIGENK